MSEAAAYAAAKNIKLAIEPLNRFECYFLNTVEDATALVKAVNAPNYGILYDTFHLNIEEKNPVASIAPAFAQINHVHVSENDRGAPGTGHVPWAENAVGLQIARLSRLVRDRGLRARVRRKCSGNPRLARVFADRGNLSFRP